MSTTSKASQRIAALLDDNSFVEIGGLVTARATDFNLKPNDKPLRSGYEDRSTCDRIDRVCRFKTAGGN